MKHIFKIALLLFKVRVKDNWVDEINQAKYLHSSGALFNELGFD